MLLFALLTVSLPVKAQMKPGDVDIFCGVDFNYRDIYLRGRFTDVLINLTPGVKWNMGHNIELAGSVLIPVINQYGDQYKYVRINVAAASWQFAVGKHWKTKLSGGIFTTERFGFDIKSIYEFNPWLAVKGEIGLTGHIEMSKHWNASPMQRLTFQAGPEFWLNRWTTMLSLRGGRYLYGDYGAVAEGLRNFKRTTVGVFAQYSSKAKWSAGFKVIIMLPPYKRWCGKVHVRPASNFRLTYCTIPVSTGNRTYFTDPEENERTGWFSRDQLPWGPETMPEDFKPCRKDEPAEVSAATSETQQDPEQERRDEQ